MNATPPQQEGAPSLRRALASGPLLPLAAALLALLLRTLYLVQAGDEPTFLRPGMDAQVYRDWARALLGGEGPEGAYFRAPLYPWLIAALGVLGGSTFWPVRILQVLASSAAAGLAAHLGRRVRGPLAGGVAGGAWALSGTAIYFDGEGLIVSLFTSLTLLLLWLLEKHRRTGRPGYALLTGLLLALLCALRANGLVTAAAALLLLAWRPGTPMPLRSPARWRAVLLAFALLAAGLSPILLHNLRSGGGLAISTQGGINLFLGNHPGASGGGAVDPDFNRDWTREQAHARAERAEGRPLTAGEVSDHYARRALHFWQEQPGQALRLTVRKLLLLVNRREVGNNRVLHPYLEAVSPWLVLPLMLLVTPLLWILALYGAPSAWREHPALRSALIYALLFGASLLPFFINARYRHPLLPALVLLAGHGAARLAAVLRSPARSLPSTLRNAAWLGIVALAVLLPRPLVELDKRGDWLFHRGNALLRLENYSGAAEEYRRLLDLYPGYRHGHLNLGATFLHLGELDSAAAHFRAELTLRPGSAAAHTNLGAVHERRGALEAAAEQYRAALRDDPTHSDARGNLADLLARRARWSLEEGELEAALSYQREAALLLPGQPAPSYNLALLLARTGQRREAEELLRRVTREFPDFQPARTALRRLLQGG